MKNNKSIEELVATSLIFILISVAVLNFQNWLQTYNNKQFLNAEHKFNNCQINVESLVGDVLYLKSDCYSRILFLEIKNDGNKICSISDSSYFNSKYLIGWWEAEGNTKDSSKYNNNGILINGSYSKGAVGKAFNLYNDNDYVFIPESQILNLQNNFTFSVWISSNETRLNSVTPQREIFSRMGSNMMLGYEKEFVNNYVWLRFYIRYNDSTNQEVEVNENKTLYTRDNKWHNIVVTFKKGNYLCLYVDGILMDNESTPDKLVKLSSSNNGYVLGSKILSNGSVVRNIKAKIDEFQIYKKSLSKNEVKNLYFYKELQLHKGVNMLNLLNCNITKGKIYQIFILTTNNKLDTSVIAR